MANTAEAIIWAHKIMSVFDACNKYISCKAPLNSKCLYAWSRSVSSMFEGIDTIGGHGDVNRYRACPILCVYRKHGGQRGYIQRTSPAPQDIM